MREGTQGGRRKTRIERETDGKRAETMREIQRKRTRRKTGREAVRRKAKRSFIIDQRNRVSFPSPIAHSIQAVFDFPLKIPASPAYL